MPNERLFDESANWPQEVATYSNIAAAASIKNVAAPQAIQKTREPETVSSRLLAHVPPPHQTTKQAIQPSLGFWFRGGWGLTEIVYFSLLSP